MTREYFRYGTKSDPDRVILQKPPKSFKMKKEKIICEVCKRYAEKMQESETYRWVWCKVCKLPISIKIKKKIEDAVS